MKTQLDSVESKEALFQGDDVFVSYNIDDESIENDKVLILKKLRNLLKMQTVNRKDLLLKKLFNSRVSSFNYFKLGYI